jgi:hypothetical protein
MQSLYEHLRQTGDGVNQFLEIIAGAKSAQLQSLESSKNKRLAGSKAGSEANRSKEAANLLHVRLLIYEYLLQCWKGLRFFRAR